MLHGQHTKSEGNGSEKKSPREEQEDEERDDCSNVILVFFYAAMRFTVGTRKRKKLMLCRIPSKCSAVYKNYIVCSTIMQVVLPYFDYPLCSWPRTIHRSGSHVLVENPDAATSP